MARRRRQGGDEIGVLRIRGESSKYLSAADVASRIENMVETPEGTLRLLNPPCPLIPDYAAPGAPASNVSTYTAGAAGTFIYSTQMHGICHASFAHTGREVLLLATGAEIWEFNGWNRGWKLIVGDDPTAVYEMELEDSTRPQWPTQFVTTPQGIVILPFEGRPLFYDGELCAELGYSQVPGAPQLSGPRSPAATPGVNDRANTVGYSHDANPQYPWDGTGSYQTQMWRTFGRGRIGTVALDTIALDDETHGGATDQATYVGAIQWIDRWGNLSPVSPRSAAVEIAAQSSKTDEAVYRPESLLKQLMWRGIAPGPGATVGRILFRSKDMRHAGTQKLFEIPAYAAGAGASVATVSGNLSTLYPDNVPDQWLITEAPNLTTTPPARLGALAFGRLFVANTPDDPGLVRWSWPGRWGTWGFDDFMYPDPNSSEVTGLHNCVLGLLVFTESSTFLVRQTDDGRNFLLTTVSTYAGCVAPNSIKTLRDGSVVWLGREGFYRMTNEGALGLISEPIDFEAMGMTPGRKISAVAAVDVHSQEYRCWVAVEGSATNNRCFVLDEQGWRRRTDFDEVSDVCVTKNHQGVMLAAGTVNGDAGVWVLDHSNTWTRNPVDGVIETAWLEPETSGSPGLGKHMRLWFREASSGSLTVTVYRDWRQDESDDAGQSVKLYRADDPPPFWDTAVYGTGVWRKRRPYWTYADIFVANAQAVKAVITGPSSGVKDWEFIGITYNKAGDHGKGGLPR